MPGYSIGWPNGQIRRRRLETSAVLVLRLGSSAVIYQVAASAAALF